MDLDVEKPFQFSTEIVFLMLQSLCVTMVSMTLAGKCFYMLQLFISLTFASLFLFSFELNLIYLASLLHTLKIQIVLVYKGIYLFGFG